MHSRLGILLGTSVYQGIIYTVRAKYLLQVPTYICRGINYPTIESGGFVGDLFLNYFNY